MSDYNEIDFDDENDGFSEPLDNNHQAPQQPDQEQRALGESQSNPSGTNSSVPKSSMPQSFHEFKLQKQLQKQKQEPTEAICIQNIEWTTNEEDIRGFAVDIDLEDQVKSVIFDEHKVNGKSKGNVYVEMTTIDAATALRDHVKQENKSSTVEYVAASLQPFRQHRMVNQNRMSTPVAAGLVNSSTGNPQYRTTPQFQQRSHYPNSQFVPNYNPMMQQGNISNPRGIKRQRQ